MIQRMQLLTNKIILFFKNRPRCVINTKYLIRRCTSSNTLQIGDVSIIVKNPTKFNHIPAFYKPKYLPQSILQHLKWMIQKDILGQDIFLIGPPGHSKRHLAMMYLELTQKEAEYLCLSRDTTESDLKQRREIIGGTALYYDQCAVRAALEGRVLILEGVEKAERNVLPILNNLLENREMQLDDGRFLVSSKTYEHMLKDHTEEELKNLKLVRVHEDFRIISIGLPIPRYQGNTLDPPFRSRFQARDVGHLSFQDHYEIAMNAFSNLPQEKAMKLLSFGAAINISGSNHIKLPHFPIENIHTLFAILVKSPNINLTKLLHRLYPYKCWLDSEGQRSVENLLKSFDLNPLFGEDDSDSTLRIELIRSLNDSDVKSVEISSNGGSSPSITLEVASGKLEQGQLERGSINTSDFISTRVQGELLCDLMHSHMVKDFCLIGQRGCGKSIVIERFAEILGYNIENIMLYQDMTSRDLLQHRTTTKYGDTVWRFAPLVRAALDGSLAVLDGLNRINKGTLSILHRLVHERELDLFDGTKLISLEKYEHIKSKNNFTDSQMEKSKLLKIHPSFRIISLSELPSPSTLSTSPGNFNHWLSPEILTMFLYHYIQPITLADEQHIINRLVPNARNMKSIINFAHSLRNSNDAKLKSLSNSLSTRQLIRIAKRLAAYPDEGIYNILNKVCLSRFLPHLTRLALEDLMSKHDIHRSTPGLQQEAIEEIKCEIRDGYLVIGRTEAKRHERDLKTKIPNILFYDNQQHLSMMEDMLKDFMLGEDLLLIGNQGVGKNKIVDRFLQLLNRPREYIQLHRDTTVDSLSLQTKLEGGIMSYEDSPLLKAVKHGRVLVIDEVDKAPTNVTCILKNLSQSGEMHLLDGRKIVHSTSKLSESEKIIKMHPDFRMIVLANRPGFPFLGNDFFATMGDMFTCHAVDNPDEGSEMAMLRMYGPNVPTDLLKKLVKAFVELRTLADNGVISYPFSTRELVNIVKHLEKFAPDDVVEVVKNVFDFDHYNIEMKNVIVEAMQKHGIPMLAGVENINLSERSFPLPLFEVVGNIKLRTITDGVVRMRDAPLKCGEAKFLRKESSKCDYEDMRSSNFTEQQLFATISIHETAPISAIAISKGVRVKDLKTDVLHLMSRNPYVLYSLDILRLDISSYDFSHLLNNSSSLSSSNYSYSNNNSSSSSSSSRYNKAHLNIVPLLMEARSKLLIHEEKWDKLYLIDWMNGEFQPINIGSFVRETSNRLLQSINQFHDTKNVSKIIAFPNSNDENFVVHYIAGSSNFNMIDFNEMTNYTITLPFRMGDIDIISQSEMLMTEYQTEKKFVLRLPSVRGEESLLNSIEPSNKDGAKFLDNLTAAHTLTDETLSSLLNEKLQCPNRISSGPSSFATIFKGLPDLSEVEIINCSKDIKQSSSSQISSSSKNMSLPTMTFIDSSQQIVSITSNAANNFKDYENKKKLPSCHFLEVVDLNLKTVTYIPVPSATNNKVFNQWFYKDYRGPWLLSLSNSSVLTVDSSGGVRLWEVSTVQLEESLKNWKQMIGRCKVNEPLQITSSRELGKLPDQLPKVGRVDPTGAPHVGGNTFAGGTGGMSTAGLGGLGGPYRLDVGSKHIFQVSDSEKKAVPIEVLQAARDMAQRAWKDRLKEIRMSELDADLYSKFSASIQLQVQSIKTILENLQAKSKERRWLKNQSYGEFDETRLIEGLVGEKSVYKLRGEREPEVGSPQNKPKYLRLVCDVSGSMYRFNGQDGRMDRQLEAVLLIMEACRGHEPKIVYEVCGHSGEGPSFDFVRLLSDKKLPSTPVNDKERLDVLLSLRAHSQFCLSGDRTLEAAGFAIDRVDELEDVDEKFIIILSDANFDRYGISAKQFCNLLTSNEKINIFVIFIGTLGNQADRLSKEMPHGRSFICMDTKMLPSILQQIFSSAINTI